MFAGGQQSVGQGNSQTPFSRAPFVPAIQQQPHQGQSWVHLQRFDTTDPSALGKAGVKWRSIKQGNVLLREFAMEHEFMKSLPCLKKESHFAAGNTFQKGSCISLHHLHGTVSSIAYSTAAMSPCDLWKAFERIVFVAKQIQHHQTYSDKSETAAVKWFVEYGTGCSIQELCR